MSWGRRQHRGRVTFLTRVKSKKLILGLVASAASVLVTLALLEAGIRVYSLATASPDAGLPPLHVTVKSPVLFSLNPAHPEVNSLGMRDDEVSVSKPQGVFRILVLGDSIAYGDGVDRKMAFPDQLEGLLRTRLHSAEVVNTAVMGYTAYNEQQYYLTKGKAFEPDLVLVAFCFNDVANPRLHWDYTERLVDVPPQAIPNQDYDRTHAQPLLHRRQEIQARRSRNILRRSRLYQFLERAVWRQFPGSHEGLPDFRAEIPTHLTGEDTLSIQVLLDETSAESRWLRSIYEELDAAVRKDGSRLAIVFFPLAYQLDPAYPYVPQNQLMEYCARQSIPCLDLLPAFRAHPKERMFLLQRSEYDDIWHLTEQGHALAAQAILRFLQEKALLEPR